MEGIVGEDKARYTVHTVKDSADISFIVNEEGDAVAHITAHPSGEGFLISIYDEPQPPPAVTLGMDTRNECLAALTGFLEARRIDNE